MAIEAEISFAVSIKDDSETLDRLRATVVECCGLEMSDIADVGSEDLVRYILDSQSLLLSKCGVTVNDSSAQVVESSAPTL